MTIVDRRTFLARSGGATAAAGAAWVAPSVLGSSTAWAAGTCPAPVINAFPNTTATTNSNGWTRTVTNGTFETGNPFSGTHGYLGISPTYNGIGPAFLCENDPTARTGGVAAVTYATTFSATAGRTYAFTFRSYSVTTNPVTQTFALIVGGVTVVQGNTAGGGTGLQSMTGLQTWNVNFVCNATNVATPFVYRFSLATVGTGDDIGVTAPAVTCSFT